jgi:hypothetical protein
MKKLIFISLIISGTLFFSCKKSSNTPAVTGGANNPNMGGQPYGELTGLRSFTYNSTTGTLSAPTNTGSAYFLAQPNNISTGIQVGSVRANGTKFQYQPSSKTYQDSTFSLSINPTTWQVTGAGPIPSFTYTNNDSLPRYTGYAILPDTIYRNQNLNLQINGISSADLIDVSIYNNTPPPSNIYQTKSIGISANNTISFSSSSLSGLSVGPTCILIVSVFKYNNQTISGMGFRFISQLEINKMVYIK